MGRPPCGTDDKKELSIKKGAWTAEEDEKLVSFIQKNKGHGSWRTLPKLAGLDRCGKSCRLRWTNYLRPNIKRGNFSVEEERLIVQLHAVVGNKWSTIASHLAGRTDNEVKNHWNTHLKKRLTRMGIDPVTHLPLNFFLPHHHYPSHLASTQSDYLKKGDWQNDLLQRSLQLDPSIASHLVQWELTRLEAEARQQMIYTHGAYIQNHYASWLQALQEHQTSPSDMNDFIHGWNLQLQETSNPSSNTSTLHSKDLQSHVSTPLTSLQSSLCQARDWNPFVANTTTIDTISKNGTSLGNETMTHIPEDNLHTSPTTSIATPETCTTSDTLSSQFYPNQFALFDDFDIDLSSNTSYYTTTKKNDNHDTSPSTNDDISQHDSYWHRMLNLLGHATLENL